MKIKLTKSLLTFLTIAAACTAQAGYISPTTIWTEAGEMQLGTNPDNVGGYTIDVKDGDSEATVSKDVVTTSGLFVRNGKLTIGGTDTHNTVKINPVGGGQLAYQNGTPTVLNVAGKDAVVVIDNATVTTDYETASAVGGPDGNGTLIIQNGGKYDGKNQYYFFVGYKSYRLEGETPDYSGNGQNQQISHATTNNVGDSRVDADGNRDFSNRYEGTYTKGVGGTEFGRGVVTVTGNSEFNATGIKEFCMGEAELNIRENSIVTTSASPVCLGNAEGGTTVVNVESGSVFDINGQLQTSSAKNTKTIINVNNATMNLNNKKGAFLGVPQFGTESGTTEFNLQDGGRLNVSEELYIGYKSEATMTIAKTAIIKDFGNIHDGTTGYDESYLGTPQDRLIVSAYGILENAGTLDIYTVVDGGEFTMVDGAVAAALTATTGTINLSGDVTFTGTVELGSPETASGALTINIEQGSTIHFYDEVTLSNAVINVLLNDESYEGEQLFTIASVDGLIPDALKDIDLQLSFNGSTVNTVAMSAGYVATKTIPEPTTATLSLLALAGLSVRRRRH